MGITTTTVAERRGKECRELCKDSNMKTNSKSRKNRRRQKKEMLPIQRLFDTCKEVFANTGTNIVPDPHDVERLRTVLDDLEPMDVGLTREMPYFRIIEQEGSPIITYLHLYECDKFSMGIFCLPPSGVIPLHNHPGMTVFSKLLFGTMHIKSYDWVGVGDETSSVNVNVPPSEHPKSRLAKVAVDSNFTAPCETSILYPTEGGNMHCFTAVTPCAVLDVLGPPYSDTDGRHCTYYLDHPVSGHERKGHLENAAVVSPEQEEERREGYAWLQERDWPEELSVLGAPYRGPMFVG